MLNDDEPPERHEELHVDEQPRRREARTSSARSDRSQVGGDGSGDPFPVVGVNQSSRVP